jgi:hypothetical protein
MDGFRHSTRLVLVIGLLALMWFSISGPAMADGRSSGPLDGMVFVGKIGPKGNPDLDDELHFRDGKFWSAICTQCGFKPGDYWVRNVGNGIEFRGELVGDRGTFHYRGAIVDGEANVSIGWTKSRWYWTIERELEFVGEMRSPTAALSVDGAVGIAVAARPEQNPICRR